MSTALRAFERALHAIVSCDAETYASAFAPDGTVAWPFSPAGWPSLLVGREAIASHVGANLARSQAAGRRLEGPHDVVVHPVSDTEIVVELAVDVITADGGRDRLPYVHVYTTDAAGSITSLRDYVGPATMRLAEAGRQASLTELARRLYAAIDARDWSAVAPLLSSELEVRHGGDAPIDADGWRAALEGFHRAFPDGRHEIDDVLVSGDRVMTRCRYVGTHAAPSRGVAATGARVEATAVHVDRFVDGLVREHFGLLDASALRRS